MSKNNEYQTEMLEWMPQIPYDMSAPRICYWGSYHAYEFTNWREENLSWKKNCYIHAGLSNLECTVIEGPDALQFLTDFSVSDFRTLKVGHGRHTIMCNDKGNIMVHGMTIRVNENTVHTFDLSPYLDYCATKGSYDIKLTNITKEHFVFQIAGPRSLEVLEQAAEEDLHDIKFMTFRESEIAGHKVLVLRMGMGGTLSYEVHGTLTASRDVYGKIVQAGEAYDIHKLGSLTYVCNHTENGYPQQPAHFPMAWKQDNEFAAFLATSEGWYNALDAEPRGTYSQDINELFRTPLELGWKYMVNYNHEFPGKDALQKIEAQGYRKMITLRWDPEDIVDVYRSQLYPGEHYKPIEFPLNYDDPGVMGNLVPAYKVMNSSGDTIGIALWQVYTYYSREVISLCCIDEAFSSIGTEVFVEWGEWSGRKKNIRATVARFPYLNLTSNKDYDLESIPHYTKESANKGV